MKQFAKAVTAILAVWAFLVLTGYSADSEGRSKHNGSTPLP